MASRSWSPRRITDTPGGGTIPRGFESEILWDRQIGYLTLGTRVPPGGWTHNTLDASRWGHARNIIEARTVVERYITHAAAKPA